MSILNHGLLLVDKPEGITSHDVVARARRLLGLSSIGHSGTLDPMASGLMVLLLGEATKLSQVFLEKTKSYEVEFTLGVETDTLDRTGTVLRRVDPEALSDCTIERVNALAQKLQGEFEWPIPSYSAKKINGEKMYVMAREGRMEQLEVRPRKKMSFWGVGEVVKCGDPVFRVSLSCSAGSFIRTWVDQMGQGLGVGAMMSSLRRTESSPFKIEHAVKLEEIPTLTREELVERGSFVPLENSLPGMKKVVVQGGASQQLRNGLIGYDLRGHLLAIVNAKENQDFAIISKESRQLVAIVDYRKGNGFTIRRVMNYQSAH